MPFYLFVGYELRMATGIPSKQQSANIGSSTPFNHLLCSPLVESPAALRKYVDLVRTGHEKGAGTNSSVDITLFGENGDTGARR